MFERTARDSWVLRFQISEKGCLEKRKPEANP